jgi:adenylyltransferase/sulfurtransferase
MNQPVLSQRELRRFEQQIELDGIGLTGQEKIKQAKVLVVGAGGKGTEALKVLSTAGVGYIGISDDTLVQEETLGRQSIYGDNDIGKQKAIVSKQYLKTRNQFTEIKVHNIRLTHDNLERVIADYSIVADCTNNSHSHYAIAEATQKLHKPLVFSSIQLNKSFVTVVPGESTINIQQLFAENTALRIQQGDTTTPVVLINSMTGIIVANEALKLIMGVPSALTSAIMEISAGDYSFVLHPY